MTTALCLWAALMAALFAYAYRRLDRTAFPALLLGVGGVWAAGSALIWWGMS